MAPTTIVVPLDGSEFAERALPVARRLADRLECGLLLLVARDDRRAAERYLSRVAAELADARVDTMVVPGRAPAAIAAAVHDGPGRVVCMTTHGRGGLRWAMVGSVAEEVVRTSIDPVVLVGPRCREQWPEVPGRLVICVDGSPASESVIPGACSWADALRLDVVLALVIHPLDVEDAVRPYAILDPLAERVRAEGLAAHALLLRSSYAAGALVDLAESLPAAMLAVATHARVGLARFVLGSVTMGVLNSAPCPVLVTPPRATT